MSKTALITGITGQDGSYLAEFLLEKGYQVYGLFRRGSTNTAQRIAHLLEEREKKGDGLHMWQCLLKSRSIRRTRTGSES